MAVQKPRIIYWKPGNAIRANRVYLDANFIVGLARSSHVWHNSATALLEYLKERGIGLVLSSLALNEAIYQLMRLEEKDPPAEGENSLPPLPARLDDVLLNLAIIQPFEPPDMAFHHLTMKAIMELNLDPTDAFHYTAARRLNCPLVTNDTGFQKVADSQLILTTFF